jgi:hypothetical protein
VVFSCVGRVSLLRADPTCKEFNQNALQVFTVAEVNYEAEHATVPSPRNMLQINVPLPLQFVKNLISVYCIVEFKGEDKVAPVLLTEHYAMKAY